MTNPLFKGLRARLKTAGIWAINCRCGGEAIHFQDNSRWPLIGIKVRVCVTTKIGEGKSSLCSYIFATEYF